jgi:hypothetical protein
MDLHFDTVWNKLIKNWESQPRYIAVPYFTCDNDLIFDKNDVLIVNASIGAIKLGQTDAKTLRRAYNAGANIFSCDNLHAKVYVLGTTVFVGSANSSMSSRNSLIECMASSSDPHAVSEAVSFVLDLQKQSNKVDEKFLKSIEKIPVEKRPSSPSRLKNPIEISRPRCWLLGLYDEEYPGNVEEVEQENLDVEKSLSCEDEQVDWFWWPSDHNSKFIEEATPGDLFIDIWRPDKKDMDTEKVVVYRHARICKITQENGVKAKVFHVAWPNDCEETKIKWNDFRVVCERAGLKPLRMSLNSCREIKGQISNVIHQLWPT